MSQIGVHLPNAVHFLVINHESYDSSTVFGIFNSLPDAKQCAESKMKEYSPTIEEWDGEYLVATCERHFRQGWSQTRYDRDGRVE